MDIFINRNQHIEKEKVLSFPWQGKESVETKLAALMSTVV